MLHLVRHGRPLTVPGVPAAEWELDPAGFDDVWALWSSGVLPQDAAWFCSSEPKAIQTAQLLTEGEVGVLPALREHGRTGAWLDDFAGTVRRAFAQPDQSAVLVGHGTAWTVVVAELTGTPPDLERWAALGMPDVLAVPT